MEPKYTKGKSVAAAVGLLGTLLAGILADGVFDASEAGVFVTELFGAAGTVYAVWRTPNKPA